MDILKVFPALILDFLSKVIPGSILIAVFGAHDLPPSEIFLKALGVGNDIPSGWQGWWPVTISIIRAYVVGIFVALAGNVIDAYLVKSLWYRHAKRNESEFSFGELTPPGLSAALRNRRSFHVYIEHCRSYLFALNTTPTALLEKYRTAYRFFVALTIACSALPFGPHKSSWIYALLAVPCAGISVYLSHRYMEKSVEFFMLTREGVGSPNKPVA